MKKPLKYWHFALQINHFKILAEADMRQIGWFYAVAAATATAAAEITMEKQTHLETVHRTTEL